MEGRPMMLMVFVLFLAMYLSITWLAILVGIAAFFMILSNVKIHRPKPVASAAPQKEEEVLSPVVVQDVGEAPYLYPPDFRLKLKPNWSANTMFEDAAYGVGMAGNALWRALTPHSLARQRRK